MSRALDVNLLLYASDDSSPHHAAASLFLDRCASASEVICLAWTTVMAYLRMATHPAIFSTPLSHEEAMQNMEALLRLPQTRLLTEEEGFWDVYREVVQGLGVRGNLVPDAHLAALLKQHGVKTLYTNDSDFRRFSFLEVRNPLQEADAG